MCLSVGENFEFQTWMCQYSNITDHLLIFDFLVLINKLRGMSACMIKKTARINTDQYIDRLSIFNIVLGRGISLWGTF